LREARLWEPNRTNAFVVEVDPLKMQKENTWIEPKDAKNLLRLYEMVHIAGWNSA
jgi:hypothetical protein